MKKSVKIALIVSAVLFVLGSVLVSASVLSGRLRMSDVTTQRFDIKTYTFDTAELSEIKIEAKAPDIIFTLSYNGQITVEASESRHVQYEVRCENGILSVEPLDTRKWYDFLMISFARQRLTVSVPEEVYAALTGISVNNTTGNVRFNTAISTPASLSVKNSTGELEISGCTFGGGLEYKTSTGELSLRGCTFAGGLDISGSTSEIEISGTSTSDVKIKLTSGDVSLDRLTCKNLSAETTTGEIEFEKLNAENITLRASSGEIEGDMYGAGEYVVNAKSTTGRISTPSSAPGAKYTLDVRTTTGRIDIETIGARPAAAQAGGMYAD